MEQVKNIKDVGRNKNEKRKRVGQGALSICRVTFISCFEKLAKLEKMTTIPLFNFFMVSSL